MLQHQSDEPTASNAADARVTPEELNAALRTLEDKQSSTVAIGSVVDELRLNATPEQIWEQVQQQRAQAAAVQTPPVQIVAPPVIARPRRRVRWWAVAIVGVIGWAAVHNVSIQTSPSITTTSRTTTATTPPPVMTVPGQTVIITGDGQDLAYAVKGKDVTVTGFGNNVTLKGQARSVTVRGDGNDLSGDAPKSSDIKGFGNNVDWSGEQ